jgi:hypothetical protein
MALRANLHAGRPVLPLNPPGVAEADDSEVGYSKDRSCLRSIVSDMDDASETTSVGTDEETIDSDSWLACGSTTPDDGDIDLKDTVFVASRVIVPTGVRRPVGDATASLPSNYLPMASSPNICTDASLHNCARDVLDERVLAMKMATGRL